MSKYRWFRRLRVMILMAATSCATLTALLLLTTPPVASSRGPSEDRQPEESPSHAQRISGRGFAEVLNELKSRKLERKKEILRAKRTSLYLRRKRTKRERLFSVRNGMTFFVGSFTEVLDLDQEDTRVATWTKEQTRIPSTEDYKLRGILNAIDDTKYLSASQEFIAVAVETILKDKLAEGSPGLFLEAGAYDGEFLSNTLWLELEYQWTGILVEPNPESFGRLLQKRRKAWALNSCLSTTSKVTTMTLNLHVAPNNENNNLDPEIDYWKSSSRVGTYNKTQAWQESIPTEVVCIPLYSVMKALEIQHIDFLSLDVEYTEIGVLRSVPWDKISFTVMAIEHVTDESSEEAGLVKFLKTKGYSLASRQGEDWIFTNDKLVVIV